MPQSNDTVSFRLAATFLEQLDGRTASHNEGRRKKLSRNELARKLVVDSLNDSSDRRHEELQEQVRELRDAVATIRDDLATLLHAVLTRDKPHTSGQAKDMVKQLFRVRG